MLDRPVKVVGRPRRPKPIRCAAAWLRERRTSLSVLLLLLAVVVAANAWNLQGWPGRVNDDEATYVAQAWAMIARGDIAHYTYWYDHPFLGWALIAGYAALSDGFDRLPSGVMVGREFMLVTVVVTASLLFLLARRLGLKRWAGAAVVLLFGLSPLAIYFHRMVFLDNISTMLLVAAMAIAASPRRSLAAAFWSSACMAGAVLTKETAVLLLPAVIWMLVQHTERRTRPWNLSLFVTTFVMLVASYPTYALLKNELLPGDGHVSLAWAMWWQLLGRSGSGSLLDPTSGTYSLAMSWLNLDAWLLLGAVLVLPAGLVSHRMRPIAVGLLIQLVMMLRGGYMPFAYVIAMLPFAALLVGAVVDHARWSSWPPTIVVEPRRALERLRIRLRVARRVGPPPDQPAFAVVRRAATAVAAAAILAFTGLGAPAWGRSLVAQSDVGGDANSRAATQWVIENVSLDAVVVTDDYIWLDLTLAGYSQAVWLWKVDTDPEVMEETLPGGYTSMDYIVMAGQAQSTLDTLPTLKAAMAHSIVVATFGEIEIRRVR